MKSHIITINLNYSLQSIAKYLDYLTDHILHQILMIISSISLQNMRQ